MRLDRLPGTTRRQEYDQMEFGGYMHRRGAPDGSIWDMLNLCGDEAPLLVARKKRKWLETGSYKLLGIYSVNDKLLTVSWNRQSVIMDVKYDGVTIGEFLGGNEAQRRFHYMGGRVIIWPDGYIANLKYPPRGIYATVEALEAGVSNPREGWCYRVGSSAPYELYVYDGAEWVSNGPEFYPMWAGMSRTNVTFTNDTVHTTYGSVIQLQTAPDEDIKVGDAVTISGCVTHPENNKTAIIREISGNNLYFYDGTFTLDSGNTPYTETGRIRFNRSIPDMDYICVHENRLWGTGQDGLIYGSKLGDPTNFNVFDGLSTDSVFLDEGTDGVFTAAVSYGGYARFFKEKEIWTLYGTLPENFALKSSAHTGVAEGESDSLAVAGEALYYMSREGIMQYTGAAPVSVYEAFGEERLHDCRAGSDGRKYYLCANSNERNSYALYVYDTELGRWYREDLPMLSTGGSVYQPFEGYTVHYGALLAYISGQDLDFEYESQIWAISKADRLAGGVYEPHVGWALETGDFNQGDLSAKTVDRLFIRAEKGESPISVSVSYDGGATYEDVFNAGQIGWDWPWAQSSELKSQYELPIFPRRADNYRIRLEGGTGARLYGIGRSWHTGSHTWTRKPS